MISTDTTARVAVGLAGAALALAIGGGLQIGNLRAQLRDQQAASCPVLFAQAGAPFAPAAPHDPGSLATAAAANRSYGLYRCERAGYGPTPPLFTNSNR